MARVFRYSRWDGTQQGFDLDAEALFSEISDDLVYHGDLNAALRRLLQGGMEDADGNRMMGLREMLRRLRKRRREELEKHDLGGAYADVNRRLDDVIDEERRGIHERLAEPRDSSDQRSHDLLEEAAARARRTLDELPPDLVSRVRGLQDHEFMSEDARRHFEELLDELRSELMRSYFNQISEGMRDMSPSRCRRPRTCWPN
ncbi:MAG: hypothetical protein M5U31_02230 [Acidimicrobiia bacterium]|nr:hypothetical protein [Acidimicrobiia bacterium]